MHLSSRGEYGNKQNWCWIGVSPCLPGRALPHSPHAQMPPWYIIHINTTQNNTNTGTTHFSWSVRLV